MSKKILVWSLLFVVAFLWGISFLASTIALKYATTMEVLSVRWLLGALMFLILIAFKVVKVDFKGKPKGGLLLMALIQPCIYSLCELLGIKYTTVSESSVIIALIPIMVIIFSAIFLKEKTEPMIKLAVGLAFLGVIVNTVFAPGFSLGGELKGFFFLFIAITCGGIYNIMVGRVGKHYSVVEMSTVITTAGAIFYNLISLIGGNGLHPYVTLFTNGSFALNVLFLGLGCSFGAYLIYNYILTQLPAGIAACLQVNGVTLVGVISGILVVGDPFGWYTVVGIILLTSGIAIASLRGNKNLVE
ncbi:MAG: DMT family transporter [Clostridia bacterium]|nr:DMT family transporter [Clostridia bacterium]